MTGETNLATLLRTMQPVLNKGEYVFCTIGHETELEARDMICLFREKEGMTVIVRKSLADTQGLAYSFIAAWITLTVHSSLEAVGLTAAVSKALADEGISCNIVAAFYHDHIFVPEAEADKAMQALTALTK